MRYSGAKGGQRDGGGGGGMGGLWEKPVNNKRNEMSDFVRKREKEIELH